MASDALWGQRYRYPAAVWQHFRDAYSPRRRPGAGTRVWWKILKVNLQGKSNTSPSVLVEISAFSIPELAIYIEMLY